VPSAPGRIGGLVEAPDLAACLTLSKNDFIRTGARGASYLAYRKAIQEVISRQLAVWGDTRDGEARPRTARLERDLERVLEDLADNFPLLRSLVDRRAGGQRRLPMPGRGGDRVPAPLFANLPSGEADEATSLAAPAESDTEPLQPRGESTSAPEPPAPAPEIPPKSAEPPAGEETVHGGGGAPASHVSASSSLDTVGGRRRPARYGLLVQFESRPGDTELGRLVDSTIWINGAHPAYTRAMASRSLGYHTALAVALALAPLAVEARDEHRFVTEFLAHWGGASEDRSAPRRRAGRGRTSGRRM
jgi:hypothetical protein